MAKSNQLTSVSFKGLMWIDVLSVAFAKDFSGKMQLMRTYRAERTYGVDSGKWSTFLKFILVIL